MSCLATFLAIYFGISRIWQVGQRHRDSIVFEVAAEQMFRDGYVFYLIAENADAGEAAFHAYVEAQA